MSLIPLKPIAPHHEHDICFDGSSFGIYFEAEVKERDWDAVRSAFESLLDLISSQTKLDHNYHANRCDIDGIESRKLVIGFYLNDISGMRLAREIITNQFNVDLSKFKAVHTSREDLTNFLPIRAHLDRKVQPALKKIITIDVPERLFKILESYRKDIMAMFKNPESEVYQKIIPHLSGLLFTHYKIGSIEIALDLVTAAGIEWANHPEIALRLSKGVGVPRTAWFGEVDRDLRLLPTDPMKGVVDIIRRCYQTELIAGVPCYYGVLQDQSELYIATKEKPKVAVNAKPISPEVKYWLTRFEWRIRITHTLKEPKRVIQNVLGRDSFRTLDELQILLTMLRNKYHRFLADTLNVKFMLTDEIRQMEMRGIIDHFFPTHSQAVAASLLGGSGRLSVHAPQANLGQLARALELGLVVKPDGDQSPDYRFNFDEYESLLAESNYLDEKESMDLPTLTKPGEVPPDGSSESSTKNA